MPTPPKKSLSKIHVRELSASAIPSIFPLVKMQNPKLSNVQFLEHLSDMLPFGYRCVAAFDGKKMIGISGFWIHSRFWCGRHLDLDNFFVHPDYRGRKIGAMLVAWLEAMARKEKCQLMVLDAYADSFLAHRFYHREGFVATGTHFTKIPGSAVPFKREQH